MLKSVQTELQAFGKYVVQQSRSNLTKQKHNVTRDLYSSLGYSITEKDRDFFLKFTMDEYGTFLDKGVKGARPSSVLRGKQKAPNSPYSFKVKRPPMRPLLDWAKRRNIRLRDSKGRFSKGSYRTIAFILQRRIFAQGIKPSLFFTKPFIAAFNKYPNLIRDAYGKDLIEEIKENFNKLQNEQN